MNPEPIWYRTVFLSDTHLGSSQSQADALDEFLRSVRCDTLYLVGDIIDAWVGGHPIRWKPGQERALVALLEKASASCTVRYTPGNHDAVMRRFHGVRLFGTEIEHEFVHETASGQRVLVVHGDLMDKFVTRYRLVAHGLALGHEGMSRANWSYNEWAARQGRRRSEFARNVKRRVKNLTEQVSHFEDLLVKEAERKGCQAVVCGHIHRPEWRKHGNGVTYVNTGDWVETCTYAVENAQGELELKWFRNGLTLPA